MVTGFKLVHSVDLPWDVADGESFGNLKRHDGFDVGKCSCVLGFVTQ
jgi:hypothetical protein